MRGVRTPRPQVDVNAVLADTPLAEPHVEHVQTVRDGALARCRDRSGRRYALKAIDTSAPQHHDELTVDRSVTIRQEIDVFRRAPHATEHLFVASGRLDTVRWLLTRWIDGTASDELAGQLRAQNSTRTLNALAGALIDRIARLHATGYVHGDLQPAHCIIQTDGTVALIDYEFAHRPGHDAITYRGGLVHYNAPEIAQALLERRLPASYDQPAEIYSLGSMLHHLTTGRTSTNYGTTSHDRIPYEDKLRKIADGHPDLRTSPHMPPGLHELIAACLARNPAQRPTSRNLTALVENRDLG